jgi:glucose/arabinose dehydrogenase
VKRLTWALLLVGLAGAGACHYLLPERFAVNAPLGALLFGRGVDPPAPSALQARIRLPRGFSIGIWADGLSGARFLRVTPAGDLLLSRSRAGEIVLLERDANGDGRSDGRRVLLQGLDRPQGMDLHDGWLYVAETGAIGRIRFDPSTRETSGAFERIVRGLPTGGNHWSRTLRFGPDGWMYVSIGSSCNVCEESDPRRAAIVRYHPDGSGEEIFATGLRNSVGFDWRPGTGDLYATDNGRDLLGDDFPPCELNRIEAGRFYGWPYANGSRVPDPDFGAGHADRIAATTPPAHEFRAHNAPLGITFVRSEHAAEAYRGAALVALHGSWNRTRKDGYRVVSLHWQPGGSIEERDFAVGFEQDGNVIGRPVDVAEGPDGSFFVSDDYAGAVYRIASGPAPAAAPPPAARPRAGDPLAGLSAQERAARSARGLALYERLGCAGCHEPARAGGGVVPVALTGLAARYGVDDLVALLATPTPPMPLFPLDDGERRDLAVYLLTASP